MHLEINNPHRLKVDKERLERILSRAQEKFALSDRLQVTVSFVSQAEIKRLNKLYRGISRETDVLSFSYLESEIQDPRNVQEIGDIIICSEVAKKQAKKQKHSCAKELSFLFMHGLLHIIGYSDETLKGADEMDRLARELLV